MASITLHEQISRLRRQNGWTQQELALRLNVTNQAVSKWESAQCCPDIQLLPDIAALFGVTTDELLGIPAPQTPRSSADLIDAVCTAASPLSKEAYIPSALGAARALHAFLLDKAITAMPDPHPAWACSRDEIIRQAAAGDWHFTAWNEPGITTAMRHGTVLFSDNRQIAQADARRIAALLRPFVDPNALKTAFALFSLTEGTVQSTAAPEEIARTAHLSCETVTACLSGVLASFVQEDESGCFRLDDEKMHLLPLLSLFDER